jgi:hypothetical protein
MGNSILAKRFPLPVDIVLSPAWWYHNEGITFDEDFFYNPIRRVECERKMEAALYSRWGKYGLGKDRDKDLPVVGPVHLASGFLVSEMLGCEVVYRKDGPPMVKPARLDNLNISVESAFESDAYKRFENLVEVLEAKYGYVTGDIGWGGVLNTALDLRGENIYLDMHDRPDEVIVFFDKLARMNERFTEQIQGKTGTTSISINRVVRHLKPAVLLHSQCAHTMISTDDYERFLFKYDVCWSRKYRPFGIHFCGTDPHRYAQSFAKLPALDFLDVGWCGDVAHLRKNLPATFLNVRLSPVEIITQNTTQIADTICTLVEASANPDLTGVCCINMDEKVTDDKITAIFETVFALRRGYGRT